jgi:tRNA pseudouridine55 synthase
VVNSSSVSGLLNLDKPTGMTSRTAVDRVVRLVRPAKVGHAGTLDPLATGVLVVCIGPATRLIEFVQRMPKRYRATFLLGRESPTEDIEGDVTPLIDPPQPSHQQVCEAAARLVGTIQQRPPAFSALKVAGRRAYDLARAGKEVALEPRPVTIHALEVLRYEYPELVVDVGCSAGTYVRSLGRDLAESLGTAAVMSALVRTAVGDFTVEDALPLSELSSERLVARLWPPGRAVAGLPRVDLSAEEARDVAHGLFLPARADWQADELAAFDPAGRLVSILERRPDGRFGPRCNFPPE